MTCEVIDATTSHSHTGLQRQPTEPTMSTSHLLLPSPTLRMALWTDAAVSGAAGALQLAGGDALAALFGLPVSLSLPSGVFLLAYAAMLVAMARAPRLHAALVALVVFGNLGWAL